VTPRGRSKCIRFSHLRNCPAAKPNSPSAGRHITRLKRNRKLSRPDATACVWVGAAPSRNSKSILRKKSSRAQRRIIMAIAKQRITPCLWFDTEAEEAAKFYCSVFKDSKLGKISRYTEAGRDVHGKPAGSVMVVEFEIEGQTFTALNGGPHFKFNEAISLQVRCETQAEVDYFWSKLTEGGEEGPCGWLKDKYGLSWQVVPASIPQMMTDPDSRKS